MNLTFLHRKIWSSSDGSQLFHSSRRCSGLHYLHGRSPPIIHRDLSSNNVLLTPSMNAKIADLGVARIFNLTPCKWAAWRRPRALQVICRLKWWKLIPHTIQALTYFLMEFWWYTYLVGSGQSHRWVRQGEADKLVPITEANRRQCFLEEIGMNHPLMKLIYNCVNNDPNCRPSANEIVSQVSSTIPQFPHSFNNNLICCDVSKLTRMKRKLWGPNANKLADEVASLRSKNEKEQKEIATLLEEAQAKEVQKEREIEQLRQNLAVQSRKKRKLFRLKTGSRKASSTGISSLTQDT